MQDPLDGPVDVAKDHRSRTAADQNLCTPRIDELGKGPITNIDGGRLEQSVRRLEADIANRREVLKGRVELVR